MGLGWWVGLVLGLVGGVGVGHDMGGVVVMRKDRKNHLDP